MFLVLVLMGGGLTRRICICKRPLVHALYEAWWRILLGAQHLVWSMCVCVSLGGAVFVVVVSAKCILKLISISGRLGVKRIKIFFYGLCNMKILQLYGCNKFATYKCVNMYKHKVIIDFIIVCLHWCIYL